MIFHVIRADILLVARIFLAPAELGKIRTQLVKYPLVLHEKSSNKIYVLNLFFISAEGSSLHSLPSLNVSNEFLSTLLLDIPEFNFNIIEEALEDESMDGKFLDKSPILPSLLVKWCFSMPWSYSMICLIQFQRVLVQSPVLRLS